jgi:hypothetical protein
MVTILFPRSDRLRAAIWEGVFDGYYQEIRGGPKIPHGSRCQPGNHGCWTGGMLDMNFRESRLAAVQNEKRRGERGEDRCVRSSKTDVELAAAVQVYSDPASTLRTMAHNHPASQDVGLTTIQETSGKRHSPTLMDLGIQDRGYQLRRISLPRTLVNSPSVRR